MMEETRYLIKSRTSWEYAHVFDDSQFWDDSIKDKKSVQEHIGKKDLEHSMKVFNPTVAVSLVNSISNTEAYMTPPTDQYGDLGGKLVATCQTFEEWYCSEPEPSTLPREKHSCSVCGKELHSKSYLRMHLRAHAGQKPHECTQCDRSFVKRSYLTKHIEIHTDTKPFQANIGAPHNCAQCGSSFTKRLLLEKHMKIHSRIKSFSCTQCPYSCSRKGDMTKHMHKHDHEPHNCMLCDASFSTTTLLKDHMMTIHAGTKPFSCTQCSYSSSRKGDLVRHLRTHNGEQPYQCEKCQKKFKTISGLKIHQRAHTGSKPYKCSHCPAKFTNSSYLTVHERIHSGLKPYQCKQCGKCFAQGSTLRNHVRLHTGEKPYRCNVCGKAYATVSCRNVHQRGCTNT